MPVQRSVVTFAFACSAMTAIECRADFVPGRLYVAAWTPGCRFGYPNDRVYEFDPLTGSSRIFAEVPDGLCGSISGLAFSPDGARLITSSYFANALVEIDGSGQVSLAYGPAEGVRLPGGTNNVQFDQNGNLYAVNQGTHTINVYPANGAPPGVIADVQDGVSAGGSIALSPSEDIYYSAVDNSRIFRFSQKGKGGLFDQLDGNLGVFSLETAPDGTLYAFSRAGIFRYLHGMSAERELFSSLIGTQGLSTLAMSADGETLFATVGFEIYGVNPSSGAFSLLGSIPFEEDYLYGSGLTVYIPEPASMMLFVLALTLGRRMRWSN